MENKRRLHLFSPFLDRGISSLWDRVWQQLSSTASAQLLERAWARSGKVQPSASTQRRGSQASPRVSAFFRIRFLSSREAVLGLQRPWPWCDKTLSSRAWPEPDTCANLEAQSLAPPQSDAQQNNSDKDQNLNPQTADAPRKQEPEEMPAHRVQALPPPCLEFVVDSPTPEEKLADGAVEDAEVDSVETVAQAQTDDANAKDEATPSKTATNAKGEPEFTPREGRKRNPTQRLRSSELRDSMRSIFHRPMKAYRSDSPDSACEGSSQGSAKRPAPNLLDLELSHKRFQPIPVNGTHARGGEGHSEHQGELSEGSEEAGRPPKLKRGEREASMRSKRGRPPKSTLGSSQSRGARRSRDPPVRFSPNEKRKKGGALGRPPRQAAVIGEQKREMIMIKDEEKARLMAFRRVASRGRPRRSLGQEGRANGQSGRHSTGDDEEGTGEVHHRRDWGLMEVDSVGRNKPPFARTLLCHGTLPASLRGAEDTAVGRHWVIKRWPEKNTRRKIDAEVHECVKANPHANLVRIIDLNSADGILMDYWSGGDLQRYMATARRKFMPVRAILRLACQLLRAIRQLHQLKIVHSDVSPQNVFLRQIKGEENEDGEIESKLVCALGDFGHSYIVSQHEESRSSIASHGTSFVAPEVEEGSVSSMASDVYSAGKVLSELLNLSSGFKELFHNEPRAMVRHLRSTLVRMCDEDPDKRPSSTEACKSLEKLRHTLTD